MRLVSVLWGLGGFLLVIAPALYQLVPVALDAFAVPLTGAQWMGLVAWLVFMVYGKAYRGFHRSFAPRFAMRLKVLYGHPQRRLVLLAPLYAMGFVHASRTRKSVIWGLTSAIVILVILIRRLPQPWRGLIDLGVVVGLLLGTLSVLYFTARALRDPDFSFDAGLPAPNQAGEVTSE